MNKYLKKDLKNAILENNYNDYSYYIFDQPKLINDLNELKNKFSKYKTLISYSYKTNYIKSLIKYLDKEKILSEVVSPFEVDIAKSYQINPKDIIYNGPVKSEESIFYVLKNGGLINAILSMI